MQCQVECDKPNKYSNICYELTQVTNPSINIFLLPKIKAFYNLLNDT